MAPPTRVQALLEDTVEELLAGGWKIPAGHAMLALHDAAVEPDGARQAGSPFADTIADEIGHPHPDDGGPAPAGTGASCPRQAPTPAARLLSGAIDKLEELGSALAEPLLASAFSAAKRPAYDELVHLLASSGTPEALAEAVALSDRAKAQTLADLVDGTIGRDSSPAQPLRATGTREVASYRRRLSAVYAAIHESTDPQRIDAAPRPRTRARGTARRSPDPAAQLRTPALTDDERDTG